METEPKPKGTPSEKETKTPLLPKPESVPLLPSGKEPEKPFDWESLGGVIEGTTPINLGC